MQIARRVLQRIADARLLIRSASVALDEGAKMATDPQGGIPGPTRDNLERITAVLQRVTEELTSLSPPETAVSPVAPEEIELRAEEQRVRDGPLTLTSADELELIAQISIYTDLLDKLPVQIFIKEANKSEKGRKYIFLNYEARRLLGWTRSEVREKYDSDAFVGGTENSQFKRMIEVEDAALMAGRRTRDQLDWTPSGNPDSAFRLETVQVPILSKNDASMPFALCNIALDQQYQREVRAYQNFGRILIHEIGNLAIQINREHRLAARHPDQSEKHLKAAYKRALLAKEFASAVMAGFSDGTDDLFINRKGQRIPPGALISIGDILHKILSVTSELFIDIVAVAPPEINSITVNKPYAVLAVLLELIRNANKHTDDEIIFLNNGVCQVPIKVTATEHMLIWRVSNRYTKPIKYILRLDGGPTPYDLSQTNTRGATLIRQLLERAFPQHLAASLIIFPSEVGIDGWLHVEFHVPRFG